MEDENPPSAMRYVEFEGDLYLNKADLVAWLRVSRNDCDDSGDEGDAAMIQAIIECLRGFRKQTNTL